MKKQLILSVLFLVCSQVVLIGQDESKSKHEVGLNIGYSQPTGDYSADSWFTLHNSGYFLEANYNYNRRKIKPNIALGFIRHYSSDEIEAYYNTSLDPDVSRLSYQLQEFGVLYLMPGICYESEFRLRGILSINAGGVSSFQFQERNFSTYDLNSLKSSSMETNYNNGLGLAYKAMFGLKYSINSSINLSIKAEYFRVLRMKMNGSYQQFEYEILKAESSFTTSEIKLQSANFSLGLSYNL